MRTLLHCAALAALLSVLGMFVSAQAQGTLPHSANAASFGIAVIDVGYIYRNHNNFKAAMEGMKAEMQNVEASLTSERDLIAKAEERRNTFKPGTVEYKQLDEELSMMKAKFNVKMTQIQKDLLEREAKQYYQTYLEIQDAVRVFAEQNRIGLVVRFNGDAPDPSRREEVHAMINSPIVIQNKVDITGDILTRLNRDVASRPPGPGTQIPIPR